MSIIEISHLLTSIKADWRGDALLKEGIDITVATTDGKRWAYQTGDNSYTGGAYGMVHWSVQTIYPNTNCYTMAREIVNELREMVAEAAQYQTA